MEPKHLLIADDNKGVLEALKLVLEDDFDEIITVSNPNTIPGLVERERFDVYLLDMNFSGSQHTGNEGLYWMNRIREADPEAVVVFITAYGDVNLAVKAVKTGAFDFILKPWDNHKLRITLRAASAYRKSILDLKKASGKEELLKKTLSEQFPLIKGKSATMDKIYELIGKVAPTEADVLILGENGTGKEVIAREIHRLSKRRDEIFLSADIASLSASLLESELFGHKKGSFTDAREDHVGKFESASGGTLFLDEIGNLSLSHQAKLLSVLQTRTITPVGSSKSVPVDIRLICATNTNLEQKIKEGLFREDLFYRINTVTISLPPLRERQEDIRALCRYYLDLYGRKYGKPGLKIRDETMEKLQKCPWKGNVRELRHSIEKAVILSDSVVLGDPDFQLFSLGDTSNTTSGLQSLDEIEKMAVSRAIAHHKGNLTRVARSLKISRQTLYNKMKKHGL